MIGHASKDENNQYKLYIHTVPKEISCYDWNKYYVGITSKNNVNHRWENGCGYKSQPFYRAIKKYGWNNMKHDVIYDNLTYQEAVRLEQIVILLLRSNISLYGYNITAGGEGVNGYVMPQKERERRSECYKGKNNPFYNCKHTSETRKLMSLHHYDCSGDNNHHNKHVFMFDLDGHFLKEYVSITDACKDNNITDMCIIRAIQERRQGNNYFWGYKEDIIIDDNNNIQLKHNYRRIYKKDKQIEQYTLDNQYVQTYENITNAAEQVNGSRQGITASIRRNGTAYGYKWKYKENDI
jgi:group I intron endonuclease